MVMGAFPGFRELKIPENYPYRIEEIKNKEFVRLAESIYVDHAASTLYSESQLKEIFGSLNQNLFGNPHSRHIASDTTTEAIESIRNRVLSHFNTDNDTYDLIFTSGATGAIQLVVNNFLWKSPNASDVSVSRCALVYTQENHTSLIGMRETAQEKGVRVHCIPASSVQGSFRTETTHNFEESLCHNCLFVYPAQCNFSGSKYPLSWVERIQEGHFHIEDTTCINFHSIPNGHSMEEASRNRKWFVLLDGAAYVATSPLDLSKVQPDFVPISFYKMFGYPTGLGCLLVHKRAWDHLRPSYFGGGTVQMADSTNMRVELRERLHERFETGTLPFLDILSLRYGFDSLLRITGGMKNVETHVFNLSRYLICNLGSMRHENQKTVAEIYRSCTPLSIENHGSIVSFNLKDSKGNYIGYSHVERVSSLYNIYLRTGCFCNPGACQRYLNITPEELKKQFEAGHVCGDTNDLIEGFPTGCVRISFGYISTYSDVDGVLAMIKDCFVEGRLKVDPSLYPEHKFSAGSFENCSHDLLNKRNGLKTEIETSPATNVISSTTKHTPAADSQFLIPDKPLVLTDIIIYPVKSCAGVSVSQWVLGPRGLRYDRNWLIVTSSGVTLNLKRNSNLSQIKPVIDEERNLLILSYKGYESVSVSLDNSTEQNISANMCSGRICGDKIKGEDCGQAVSEWLSKVLQIKGLHLVRQVEDRQSKLAKGTDCERSLSLANESQFLAVHGSSIRLLMLQMEEKTLDSPLKEDDLKLRFRPNFVIDGGTAYEEDNWHSFWIGNCNFRVVGGCTRCQMVCVDPTSGEKSKEPMLTLGATRGKNMTFGVHALFYHASNQCTESSDSTNITVNTSMEVYPQIKFKIRNDFS